MKKQMKMLTALAAAAVFTLSSAVTGLAATGWVQSGANWTYYKSDGSMATNQWVITDGRWYWIEPNGVMATNKWVNNPVNHQDTWYYLGPDGASVRSWYYIGDKWYFFYDDFTMAKDTVIDSYKLGKDGAMIE